MTKQTIKRKIAFLYNEYLRPDYMISEILKTIDEEFQLNVKNEE